MEESVIYDGVFEGSASVRLVSKNSIAESGIRDTFFKFAQLSVRFSLLNRVHTTASAEKKVT